MRAITPQEMIDIIYPESSAEVLRKEKKFVEKFFDRTNQLRYETAVSGAMRWSWSQEAAIEIVLVANIT